MIQSRIGRPCTGRSGLGGSEGCGRRRVPFPAAGMIASTPGSVIPWYEIKLGVVSPCADSGGETAKTATLRLADSLSGGLTPIGGAGSLPRCEDDRVHSTLPETVTIAGTESATPGRRLRSG